MKKQILSILMAGTIIAAASSANASTSGVWTGADFSPSSYYIYLGAMTALSGQDINTQDGWLLRADAGYGQYDYDTVAVAGGNVDGTVANGGIQVGYRHFFGAGQVSAFLGGDITHHDQSPRDFSNSADGSEGGVKGSLETVFKPMENVTVLAMGNYSTAFDSYWTRGTVGYNFGSFTLGPEVRFLGNEEFHQDRFGLSVSSIDIGFADLSLYGGYSNNTSRGDDGAYGGLGFSKDF